MEENPSNATQLPSVRKFEKSTDVFCNSDNYVENPDEWHAFQTIH